MARRRSVTVRISARSYRLARLAAGLAGYRLEGRISGEDEPGGSVAVRIAVGPYRLAEAVAEITGEPVSEVIERALAELWRRKIRPLLSDGEFGWIPG
jgi:hypothetical protein